MKFAARMSTASGVLGVLFSGGLLASTPAHAAPDWTTGAALPTPDAMRLAIPASDGNVYLFGGRATPTAAHAFVPAMDDYEVLADVPLPTNGACGGELSDGTLVVYGGFDAATGSFVGNKTLRAAVMGSTQTG